MIETASFSEVEEGEYCRRKGLYPEQIIGWKNTFAQGTSAANNKTEGKQLKELPTVIKQLEKELLRKDKALAETASLLVLQKKVPGALGGARGRKIDLPQRQKLMALLEEACVAGARLSKFCEVVALSLRTMQRLQRLGEVPVDGQKAASRNRVPANKPSEAERSAILKTADQVKFTDLPPSQIVPKLADEGRYLASESTFYRILRAEKQLAHRGRAKVATNKRPQGFFATAPNQLWS